MENEAQPNIPPIQPPSQTPPAVSPSTNWSKILLFTVLGVLVVAGLVFVGTQIGKNQIINQQSITAQPTASPTQTTVNPTTTPTINTNWKTFIDSSLVGFSFTYDDKEWQETTEDLKLCNGQQCGPSMGRVITLANNKYPDPLRSIILTITFKNEYNSAYDNNQICFPSENIQQVGDWYRAQSPYLTSNDEARDHLWQRWFYQKNVVSEDQGKKCIFGSINEPKGSTTLIKYKGKQTTLSISLSNKFDSSKNNIADEIVKTIKINN